MPWLISNSKPYTGHHKASGALNEAGLNSCFIAFQFVLLIRQSKYTDTKHCFVQERLLKKIIL